MAAQGFMPKPGPVQNDPALQEIVDWAQQELVALAERLTNFDFVQQNVLHAAPLRPREGLTVVADGTDWNPGSGAGQYTYIGGAWVFGNTPAPDLTGYLTKADNLNSVANKATSRSNLGVAIGTDVLAYDAQLTSNIRQNQQDANYTLVLTDAEKHIYHTSGSAHTWTIPANASVAYPVGTAITFVNDGAGVVTIAITSDTLVQAGTGSTGSRTLAQYGLVTAIKVTTTRWFISGSGLT